MTTIALHSDLHLELQMRPDGWLLDKPDILVLAGDIISIEVAKNFLVYLAELLPSSHIIFVAGNHEYYGVKDILQEEQSLRKSLEEFSNIHFLQCDLIEIAGIRFVGCTGWSQMLCLGKEKQSDVIGLVRSSINDFYKIGYRGECFTPQNCFDLGQKQHQWLNRVLYQSSPCVKTVVITHFAPSLKVANPKYPIDELSAYFHAGFDSLIERHKPDYWMYGHNHFNQDLMLHSTRVISNQRGYGRECENSYKPNLLLSF
ncbi:MAG: metallophosphoesterase [Oleiphilus sp.]